MAELEGFRFCRGRHWGPVSRRRSAQHPLCDFSSKTVGSLLEAIVLLPMHTRSPFQRGSVDAAVAKSAELFTRRSWNSSRTRGRIYRPAAAEAANCEPLVEGRASASRGGEPEGEGKPRTRDRPTETWVPETARRAVKSTPASALRWIMTLCVCDRSSMPLSSHQRGSCLRRNPSQKSLSPVRAESSGPRNRFVQRLDQRDLPRWSSASKKFGAPVTKRNTGWARSRGLKTGIRETSFSTRPRGGCPFGRDRQRSSFDRGSFLRCRRAWSWLSRRIRWVWPGSDRYWVVLRIFDEWFAGNRCVHSK